MKHNPGFQALVNQAREQIRECTVADVKARMDRGESFHLIDVREDREYAAGRIPGARHIGRGVLERDVETLIPDPDADLVLYCGGGFRSALAAVNLQKMGYRRVVSMDGGIRGWREAGYPEDLGPAPAPGV
jgi:rhodanese-related sulfurtransferase